ncbi:MAG: MBL fold metallo-hydrolase [Thermoprotei archaeon]
MVSRLTLTVINDNSPAHGLLNDWGWSLLVESDRWRSLFDAGPSPEILENNFRALNLKLEGLSFAFLSHPHHDHYGGLPAVAKANPGMKVYVPAGAARCVPQGLKAVEVEGIEEIAEDFWSTGTFRSSPVDEQSAVVKLGGENVLLVGCSHPGIGRIAEFVGSRFGDVFFVIGGFHQPPEEQLRKTFSAAMYVAPAHCSGDEAKRMARELGGRYVEVRTGTSIAIEEDEKPTVIRPRAYGLTLPFSGPLAWLLQNVKFICFLHLVTRSAGP